MGPTLKLARLRLLLNLINKLLLPLLKTMAQMFKFHGQCQLSVVLQFLSTKF